MKLAFIHLSEKQNPYCYYPGVGWVSSSSPLPLLLPDGAPECVYVPAAEDCWTEGVFHGI